MKFSRYFLIGITISTAIVIFVFGLLFLNDRMDYIFDPYKLKFTVIFDNIQGIDEGGAIVNNGIRIGRVLSYNNLGNRVAVEVAINKDFELNIPIDSKFEIRDAGFMEGKIINVSFGKNKKNSIENEQVIQGGSREVDFSEITPGINPIIQDLASFTRSLKALLGEEESEDIRETLVNLESLTSELDCLLTESHQLVSNKEDRKNLSEFLENINSASKNLNEITTQNKDEINSMISDFSDAGKNLSNVSKKLDNLLEGINNGDGSLGELLKGDDIAENLNGLINDIRFLVEDFNENTEEYLKKYIRASKKVKKEK